MAITADGLVQREVFHCASQLVGTLASTQNYVDYTTDLTSLAEQAFELSTPIDDFEEAAIQEGWTRNAHNGYFVAPIGHDLKMADYDDWQELCEAEQIEPYQREIFEHWIISDWLADRLAEKGEKVDKDFAGMTIWARTTTGQCIAQDYVIQQIVNDLNNL
jgi:hypothetical protein